MKRIVVVGAGNLGRRHMQSLGLSEYNLEIFMVDASEEALQLARELYEQSDIGFPIHYMTSLENVVDGADAAIVATTANPRLKILDTLIQKGTKNIVLEKVAFNSVSDIDDAYKLVNDTDIKVWVNCPRRLYPIYQQLKERLAGNTFKRFSLSGDHYGMACNGIHFIDLLAYLIDDSDYQIDATGVSAIEESKRSGYVEFFGSLKGKFSQGCEWVLTCGSQGERPQFEYSLEMAEGQLLVNEQKGKAELRLADQVTEIEFTNPYQSELSGPLVDQILGTGECLLTSFDESIALHRPFIAASYELYAKHAGENERQMVPIT
ncbi:Gfo/Idh/MocA family oxidoreductase [Pontibacterium granulatum]|uniref:Gfo/Idh/MocA family oxidoreductase n=1 Tax=Pontibacterium granulatum TaxID=2036029 RepID=UPI00249B0332|nr:Gfo/Idh/MocA family oxidoreductase [Pontibacterium granulatum]MDI3323040.1 Gfo/Idh/MocA family oxidoreductase [Pontibacterium granulatum]